MVRYPSEIFGYPASNSGNEAREIRARHWCPFVDKVCYKQSRLLDIPFGVCTAHVNGEEVALCPRRFLDGHVVFSDCAEHQFKTRTDIIVFSETRLGQVGSFDFVMVQHQKMSAEIEDFGIVEFQTGQTTQTGQLVRGLRDSIAGETVAGKSYDFGLNLYDIWKRAFTQVLNKGVIMEAWKKRIYWVIQEPVYKYFEARYNLEHLAFDPVHSTVFAVYDLKPGKQRLELVLSRMVSASMDQLFAAFRDNPNIPSLDKFVAALKGRTEAGARIAVQLGRPGVTGPLDVRPPAASGRIREAHPKYQGRDLFEKQ